MVQVAAVNSNRPEDISPEEWDTRVDLAAAYRLVDLFGWSDLLGTHLSARVPGPDEHFLLNPFGVLFEEMRASDLIKVDGEGKTLSDSDYSINPAGFVIHGAVHVAEPELTCVMHTHTAAGLGVACQQDGLLPLTQQSLSVIAQTSYHDYEGLAFDLSEQERLLEDLGGNRVLILRNHGLLTVGKTIGEAFMWMYRAERACRFQLAFQQSGAKACEIPQTVIDKTIEQGRIANSDKGHRPIGQKEWPALRRKLDRANSGYDA